MKITVISNDKIIDINRLFLFILFLLLFSICLLLLNSNDLGSLIDFPESPTKKMEVNKTNNTKYIVTL